jgi:phthiocerol/phenolphthiocerol synthesis type-I polyketide synthase E
MSLLSARVPRSFLVRPHEDGAPVPLPVRRRSAATATAVESVPAPPVTTAGGTATSPPPAPVVAAEEERGTVTDRLAKLWERTIGVAPSGDADDFFDAGGNSLTAVELAGLLRAEFGTEVGIGLLLDVRTFGGLREIVTSPETVG